MLPSSDGADSDRGKALRRWGPLAAIAAVAVVVVGALALGGGSGDDSDADEERPRGTAAEAATGAVSWSMAEADGSTADRTWPETCDQDTGRVAVPFLLVSECYADVEGDNGGETSKGVTADAIKVVAYLAQEDDPVIDYITQAIANDDTNAEATEMVQGYVDMFNATYQLYGRQVDLQILVGSGVANDEVAARADAVKAAEEMGAFAVIGGPVLTSAFADELAARNVVCVGCNGGDPAYYEERAPYLYSPSINADQVGTHLVEYIRVRLAGKQAEFAGDDLKTTDRSFGYLWIESSDSSAAQAAVMEERLTEAEVELTESISYTLDPARLQEQATSIITRLKSSGVTTVIFSGDPVSPSTFTTEATAQGYFPEWLLGPQSLVDTTAFSRTYDQQQWAHAFGPSPLTVKPDRTQRAPWVTYEWFHGTPPPASDTASVTFPGVANLFAALSSAGPELTPENIEAGVFSRPPTPRYLTESSQSYGDHGLWDFDDYSGSDDMTEVWWDAETEGEDEIGREGTGVWRYVDGGRRYLPDEWEEGGPQPFDPEGSETVLDAPPAEEQAPDYPAPR